MTCGGVTSAMTDQIDPIKALKAARYNLVRERRGLAVAIALGHRRRRTDNPQSNETRETFIFIQNTIETIDRAIAHEQLIADEPVEIFTLPSLEPAPPVPALELVPATVPAERRANQTSRDMPSLGPWPQGQPTV